MVAALNIGLNLSTALLINVLIIATAVVLTTNVRSTAARIARGAVGLMMLSLIVVIVFSLPHASLL